MSTTTKSAVRGTGAGRQNGRTKSQWTRDLLKEGKSIAEITRVIPNMGYAFAYGIAKRTPHPDGGTYADHAADRRKEKTMSVSDGVVTIRIKTGGRVLVDTATGKVTRKAK